MQSNLTMSNVSKHIKQESLKNIVLKDVECEQKLAEIKELLGLPVSEDTPNLENEGNEESNVSDDQRIQSRSRILEGLKGKELKLANQLLIEIEKSTFIDWDDDTLELLIDNKLIAHSNIKLLTAKLVHESSPQIPLGFVSYVDGLLRLKLPLNFFRDSDAIQTREALIVIRGRKEGEEEDNPQNYEDPPRERKRVRSESEGETANEDFLAKKRKVDDPTNENEVTDVNVTAPDDMRSERRSPRLKLKPKLDYSWQKFNKL